MGNIINCEQLSQDIYSTLSNEIAILKKQGHQPSFATILVGNNAPSLIYIKKKFAVAETLGIKSSLHHYEEASTTELIEIIKKLNNNPAIHGIFVQLPLPSNINSVEIINHINPKKDVDGLTSTNLGNLILEKNQGTILDVNKGMVPCTPLGCMHILGSIVKDFSTKKAVVLGRSTLVGIPMWNLLLNNDCTVSLAHSLTENVPQMCKEADILVVAIGRPKFINENYIKKGAIVLDVGISRILENGKTKIVGDVDLDSVVDNVSYITTVPKGVGLLTVATLMSNIVKACMLHTSS